MSGYQDNHARNAKYGVTVFDTIAQMKAMLIFDDKFPQEVKVLGTNTKGDGGDRAFYWDSTATDTGNDIDIIDLDNHSGDGRYKVLATDGTYYFEWGGFPEELTDNHAYAINKVLMAAWEAGITKCTLKKKRDGMCVWGAFLPSDIEQDYKYTEASPFIPPDEDIPTSKIISFFASGVEQTVPEDMVDLYSLRSSTAINPMIKDPDVYPDHRYLHPLSPTPVDTIFLEFIPDTVFPPYTTSLAVNDAATVLAPGDLIGIFRPRYADAVDQSMFEINQVASVNYRTINLTWPLNRPYHKDPWGTITPGTVHGGVAKIPNNFVIQNSTVKNLIVNCTNIPYGKVLVTVWCPWPSLKCKLENVRIFGGEYNLAIRPKGRYNEITNVQLSGLGKLIANEQGCTENKYTDCIFQLTSWDVYAASYVAFAHFGETASAQFFNCTFAAPPFNASVNPVTSVTQWKGSVNNVFENCTFQNFNTSIASVLQIDGWGHATVRENKFFGNAQTQIIAARTGFYTTSAGSVAREIALHLEDNEFNLVETDLGLTALEIGSFSITTPVVARNNSFTIDWKDSRVIPNMDGIWRVDGALTANNTVRNSTLPSWRDEILFENNRNLPGAKRIWVDCSKIQTNGTRHTDGRIILSASAITYLYLDLTDIEFESRWILGRMLYSDYTGVGGVMRFGEGITYKYATDGTFAIKDISYADKTVAAMATTQELWLSESLRDITNGLGSSLIYRAKIDGTHANHTAPDLYLEGFEFYTMGGK